MNYTLHQLQVFLKVAQCQSITKAAEELHLTQPAVSIQLKNFQDQFEIPLTEIIGRKLYVTDFGKEIVLAAEKIINEVHAINYKMQAYQGKLSGRLKISIVSTGKYIMPFFLADFLKLHPDVELILDVTNKSKVIKSLERNEVDFSLVSILPETLKINRIELMPNLLFLVSNSATEFPEKIYDKTILENIPIISREMGSGTRQSMEQFMLLNNLKVKKKLELTSNEAVKQAVIAGLGCSIMPIIGLKNEISIGNLQIITVRGLPIQSTWNLIWHKNKNFSPIAKAYLAFLEEYKQDIIKNKFDWVNSF
ncbi:LysR family transcriptional regulator [Flavobacterium sp.]|jgi:DNA-binding transcriptional LysR family regulator|uniref:LysR family transcriptional regulator n=1 Tax=Flavobacterium sp. TaxID=239 RepID=UPI0022CA30E0|nr:LysR family transcriptional regulator [Flavobacterium sp.]MCZ8229287.1 LysR family transcriptional regulator [Flavobacterium sp.]